MTLDLVEVAAQVPLLVTRALRERNESKGRLDRALELLHNAAEDPEAFTVRVQDATSAWTLALPCEGRIDGAFSPPDPPVAYTALAVDGSSIDVDRHVPVDCYVLNLGWAHVRYGDAAGFAAGTQVELQPAGDELILRDADDPSHESAVAGAVLDLLRGVRELALLADLAEQRAVDDVPLLALVDGNLALWNLDKPGLPHAIIQDLKFGPKGTVQALNRLQKLAESGRVVFGGYVSGTGAANVAHSLRLVECRLQPTVVCKACPGKPDGVRPCDSAGVPGDGELMRGLLAPWQRSAVFRSHRAHAYGTAETWYAAEGHEIAFFYVSTGSEVARIELPLWMANDPSRLGLLHALIVRQAQAGGAYPLALQEAHEQAVISTGDRACFSALLEREGELSGIPWLISAKALSKRMRAI